MLFLNMILLLPCFCQRLANEFLENQLHYNQFNVWEVFSL